ncbi:MAG TPA: PAS domain S-box protein [Candidatus Deferrimicrobiaceae bacterium]|nr:PAS domain S-box protein [Candidatus Deferrimicrobiaceae bacterium]
MSAARGARRVGSVATLGRTPPGVVTAAAWTGGPGRLLLDALPAMTVIVDERGDIVAANEAWRRFGRENGAGPAVAEGVGQNYFAICRDATLAGCPPDTRAAAGIARVLRRELPIFTLDYACHGREAQRWFMLTVTPLEDGAVIAHTDITARRRTEMSAAALIETGRELAGGLEPAEVARQVASSVVRVFGAKHSALYRLEREAEGLVCIAAAGVGDPAQWHGQTFRLGEATVGRAAAEERTVWTPDVLADPKISLPERVADRIRADGFRSVLAVPLKAGERIIGALTLGDVAGRTYTEDELALLAAFVGQGAVALENSALYREIRDARDFLQSITENSPDAIITTDGSGRVTYFSRGAEAMFGYSAEEMIGTSVVDLYPGGREEARSVKRRLDEEGQGLLRNYESGFLAKDGRRVEISASISVLRDASGAVVGTLGLLKDIGERRRLEEQLRQSQKMDAIGRLAGGIAHDFNNLLTVIAGRAHLILSRLRPEEPIHRDATLVRTTAERAAALTQQLLAFSRKQVLQPQVLDLNAVTTAMEPMLRRLIGEDIDLAVVPAVDLGRVKADPGQIEQVIVNLVVNSRDAMPQGGRLTVETANVDLDEAYASRHVSVPPGPYVMLAVSDTGEGMDEQTRSRVFEPFFTTKGPGKGTGLGLATVYGIVKQSGGDIRLYSELGAGTTFKIYLPRVTEPAGPPDPGASPAATMPRGDETVLLVEDEPEVRDLAREILEGSGYTVLQACDAQDAVFMAERHGGPIHLLLTDVIMPRQSGRALVERLRPLRPEMHVLYMSGYTNEAIVRHGVLDPDTRFIQKPFTPAALGYKVRAALDGATRPHHRDLS